MPSSSENKSNNRWPWLRLNPHWTGAHKFAPKSFDVTCVQCQHSHSRQQVPFACIWACAFSVNWVRLLLVWAVSSGPWDPLPKVPPPRCAPIMFCFASGRWQNWALRGWNPTPWPAVNMAWRWFHTKHRRLYARRRPISMSYLWFHTGHKMPPLAFLHFEWQHCFLWWHAKK